MRVQPETHALAQISSAAQGRSPSYLGSPILNQASCPATNWMHNHCLRAAPRPYADTLDKRGTEPVYGCSPVARSTPRESPAIHRSSLATPLAWPDSYRPAPAIPHVLDPPIAQPGLTGKHVGLHGTWHSTLTFWRPGVSL